MKDLEKQPATKEQQHHRLEKQSPRSRLSGIRLLILAGLSFVLYSLYIRGAGLAFLRDQHSTPTEMKISNGITRAPGYNIDKVIEESAIRFKATLKLAGEPSNAHGIDVEELVVEAEYESEQRLHVKIYDAAEKAYQIPTNLLPPPPSTNPSSPELAMHYHPTPFAFWVTRRSNDEVIFDTRQLSSSIYPRNIVKENGDSIRDTNMPAHPLIFSDQYLQLSTAVPEGTNIYGLGEVIASSGIRRDPNATVQAFWNRDSAGSPHDSNMYGTHPFYIEKRLTPTGSLSHGVFMRSSHGMDVILRPKTLQYRILGGVFDMYFFSGPTPINVIQQYAEVVGKPAQMPFWTFGFHLCRFGYASIEETREAVERMEKEGIPMESIWNDLDHMNHRRDFDLAPSFPGDKFKAFTDWLHSRSQHYIPIVDVAIGVPYSSSDDYPPYTKGHEKDVFIHSKNGSEYIGKVWPGDTVFPDWTNPATDGWWQDCLDEYKAKGVGYDGIWCDMNEPASFDAEFDGKPKAEVEVLTGHGAVDIGQGIGAKEEPKEKDKWDYPSYAIHQDWKSLPDHTVPPSAKLYDGSRAYDSHNTYGFEEIVSTHKALIAQSPEKRPFILSRSTFSGQGKYSAHWLGDNYSTWQSLRDSLQGVLQFQWFQIPMVGPDACGFTGNTTEELCNRWSTLSAFFPFYRNHNSMEYISQEPYVWPSVAEATKRALGIRYSLLPFWESLFAQAHAYGTPPLQPFFFAFDDPALASVDRQFLIGSNLLVTPVLHEGETSVKGYFPSEGGTTWRDWYTHELVEPDSSDQAIISAPLGHIPLHIRSGSIILIHNEPKYTLTETRKGDYGLIVNLDANSRAEGFFYLDDGISIDGADRAIAFALSETQLKISSQGTYAVPQRLSTLTVIGCTAPPSLASLGPGVSVEWNEKTGTSVISGLSIDLNESSEMSL